MLLRTGDQLRMARLASGLSQSDLAVLSETHANTISNLEAKDMLFDNATVRKLSKTLVEGSEGRVRIDDLGVMHISL